jgi:hypothetical protein
MWTQSDLDKLDKAIATGAKSVQFGSGDNAHRTEFRSLAEMWDIRDRIARHLAGPSRSTTSFVEHSRD